VGGIRIRTRMMIGRFDLLERMGHLLGVARMMGREEEKLLFYNDCGRTGTGTGLVEVSSG
jgi:hypothetical protein